MTVEAQQRTIACVVPTHQRPEFLTECLESLAAQTTSLDLVVVVSDVNDPAAAKICHRAASRHAGLTVEYVECLDGPGGASASRNAGAVRATTDYVAFLDDDDLWKPTLVAEVRSVIDLDQVPMVVVSREIFSETESVPGPRIRDGLKPHDVAALSLGTTGSNMVVARSAFDAIGGFDSGLPVKNDTDFFLRFLLAGFSYSTVQEDLVRQRKHGLGQLTTKNERRAAGTEAYIAKHRAHLSRADVRRLRVTIHRIRKRGASTRRARLRHLAGAVWNYSPTEFVRERRQRGIWSVGG